MAYGSYYSECSSLFTKNRHNNRKPLGLRPLSHSFGWLADHFKLLSLSTNDFRDIDQNRPNTKSVHFLLH